MRRIVLWALSTLSALVLLFAYHTSLSGPTVVASAPAQSGARTASGSDPGSKTVTGSVAQTRWGPVQVRLTVNGGKITQVDVPQYPQNNPRDVEINDRALPVLTQETVDAQSAQIDMVSGATVTSDGYLQSLQSALDEAGL